VLNVWLQVPVLLEPDMLLVAWYCPADTICPAKVSVGIGALYLETLEAPTRMLIEELLGLTRVAVGARFATEPSGSSAFVVCMYVAQQVTAFMGNYSGKHRGIHTCISMTGAGRRLSEKHECIVVRNLVANVNVLC